MKKLRIINDEQGSALPIVTLLLAFVILGICALVFDAGILYSERRTMVTAADSAALAGAAIMEQTLNGGDVNTARIEAETIAGEIALANGVSDLANVEISWIDADYTIDVIKVTVKNNKELFFARFLGFENTDVSAKAIATWGFVTRLEGGDIIPVFVKDEDYQTTDLTYLHAGKCIDSGGDIVNGNWGLIDIFGSTSGIADAMSGEDLGKRMEIDYTIQNQTGLNAGNLISPIEDRMEKAALLTEKEDRIKYMCGLVPIIDWDLVSKQGSTLQLPIKSFAVFEIYDVIVSEGNGHGKKSEGSPKAMYDKALYTNDGIAVTYDSVIVDGEEIDLEKATIIGKFRDDNNNGGEIDVRAIVQPGDQENPDPSIISVTYSKLIE